MIMLQVLYFLEHQECPLRLISMIPLVKMFVAVADTLDVIDAANKKNIFPPNYKRHLSCAVNKKTVALFLTYISHQCCRIVSSRVLV